MLVPSHRQRWILVRATPQPCKRAVYEAHHSLFWTSAVGIWLPEQIVMRSSWQLTESPIQSPIWVPNFRSNTTCLYKPNAVETLYFVIHNISSLDIRFLSEQPPMCSSAHFWHFYAFVCFTVKGAPPNQKNKSTILTADQWTRGMEFLKLAAPVQIWRNKHQRNAIIERVSGCMARQLHEGGIRSFSTLSIRVWCNACFNSPAEALHCPKLVFVDIRFLSDQQCTWICFIEKMKWLDFIFF